MKGKANQDIPSSSKDEFKRIHSNPHIPPPKERIKWQNKGERMKEEECSHPFNRDKWKEVEREDGLREWSLTFNQRQGGGGLRKQRRCSQPY